MHRIALELTPRGLRLTVELAPPFQSRPVIDTTGVTVDEPLGLVLGSPTVPASAAPAKGSAFVPGTLGFELYLAVVGPRSALRAPRTPRDLEAA